MAPQKNIPIDISKGKWSTTTGADPTLIPDGYCTQVRNLVSRPNRYQTRDPFVYDSLMNIRGIAQFDDQTNKVYRLMAVDSSQAVYEKATSGDTWSSSKGTAGGTRLTDYANYRGVLYGMMDDGSGNPTAAWSFDGTNFSTTPFNSAIQGRTVTPYLDRILIAYPRVTVAPVNTAAQSYTLFSSGANANIATFVSGSTTIVRAFPTSTSSAAVITAGTLLTLGTNAIEQPFVIRQDLRNHDPINAVPVAIYATVRPAGGLDDLVATGRSTAVTVGQLGRDTGTNFLFRCTTAGTTAVGAPSFAVALGATVTDGTAVWTAELPAIIGKLESSIPSLTTANNQWSTFFVPIIAPWSTNNLTISMAIAFSNSTTPNVTALNAVDIAYKDGLADGDARKQNYGFQLTRGDFYYPFLNTETAASATFDLKSIIWSDVQKPKSIRASGTYNMQETVGLPTAAVTVAGRYMVSTRSAWWVFTGNEDTSSLDVIPIRKERIIKSAGCIGPKARDVFEDTLYFIGEDSVYQLKMTQSALIGVAEPQDIAGDAMREEIMNRGANWVESQSTYNMPLLRVNKKDREIWVYTQKGTIHVYHIDKQAWNVIDVASNAEIADFHFNDNTRKMYVAVGGFGLARVDWAASPANDTVDNTVNTYTCTKDLITKPIEAFGPRVDALIESVGVFHTASASQTGQTLTASASTDRGTTYPYTDQITVDTTTPRELIYVWEMAPSVTLKLSHVGQAGASVWSISKLDVTAQVMRDEMPQTVPTGTFTG